MNKFQSKLTRYFLMLEAPQNQSGGRSGSRPQGVSQERDFGEQGPENDEDDFGQQGVGEGADDLDVETQPGSEGDAMDMSDGASDPNENKITSPEEWELGKLAVRALMFDPNSIRIEPRVFTDFEKRKNVPAALEYVETLIGKQETGDHRRKFGQVRVDKGGGGGELEIAEIQGRPIATFNHPERGPSKMDYFNKKLKGEAHMDHGRRIFWTRLILNALKYPGNDYNLVPDELTPETMKHIFDKLKHDFNSDTRGMFYGMGNEREDMSGPGVF